MPEVETYEIIYRPGTPPSEGGHPGFGYRVLREPGMIIERDVAVQLRDGVTIYVDVYRPENEEPAPVLLEWGPYGKHFPAFTIYGRFPGCGVRAEWVSEKHVLFEGSDPTFWCPRGYAIVGADPRGTWYSEGEARYADQEQEAADCGDVIEWAAGQPWSYSSPSCRSSQSAPRDNRPFRRWGSSRSLQRRRSQTPQRRHADVASDRVSAPQHAVPLGRGTDCLLGFAVKAGGHEPLQSRPFGIQYAKRRVAPTGETARGVEHPVEHHLHIDLREHPLGDVQELTDRRILSTTSAASFAGWSLGSRPGRHGRYQRSALVGMTGTSYGLRDPAPSAPVGTPDRY